MTAGDPEGDGGDPEVMEATPGCREITFNDSNHSIIEGMVQILCIFDETASITTIGGGPGRVRDFFIFFTKCP